MSLDIHTTGKVSIGKASKESVESFVAVINETETPGKLSLLIRKATRNIYVHKYVSHIHGQEITHSLF